MPYLTLITLAALPSLIWLLFYLRKDNHPESNAMILFVFFMGITAAVPVIFIEKYLIDLLNKTFFPQYLISFLQIFFAVAFFEELFKYLVIKLTVLKSSELDEPLDIILYMIISALGFAFLENLLIFFSPWLFFWEIKKLFLLSLFRSISATFLHALASGILGFFLAWGFFEIKKKKIFFLIGLSLATLLHGLYNLGIITLERLTSSLNNTPEDIGIRIAILINIFLIVIMITAMAIFVSKGFKKLKKIASVCKIK